MTVAQIDPSCPIAWHSIVIDSSECKPRERSGQKQVIPQNEAHNHPHEALRTPYSTCRSTAQSTKFDKLLMRQTPEPGQGRQASRRVGPYFHGTRLGLCISSPPTIHQKSDAPSYLAPQDHGFGLMAENQDSLECAGAKGLVSIPSRRCKEATANAKAKVVMHSLPCGG